LVIALASALTATAAAPTIRVQISGRVVELDVERYVAGVLAGESSVFQSPEAMKAMAVAARTYAEHFRGRHAAEGFDLCDKTHCQRLDLKAVTARLAAAAASTASELLLYQGRPAIAYYHLDCGGRTEDVRAVWPEDTAPYLTSHADPYCVRRKGSAWHWDSSLGDLSATLQRAGLRTPKTIERVTIEQRTPSGRSQMLALTGAGENVRVSASALRFAVGRLLGFNTITSDKYNVGISAGRVVFNGTGSGHGVGMCQDGAEQMGLEGHSYREILAFYYQGTTVGQLTASTKQISWQRISGERISLFTTQPDQDKAVLINAERLLRGAETRLRLTAPENIELRIYPDIASFRDATGEPGWVAARTSGHRIQLQPASLLRSKGALESSLQHELFHAILEPHSKPGLPVWFREGFVAYLTASGGRAAASIVYDGELQQRSNENGARSAYDAAHARVAALVRRYGETTVVDWLRLGLPLEVTNANNKQNATKSK
jgi:stage II sporulation protein D